MKDDFWSRLDQAAANVNEYLVTLAIGLAAILAVASLAILIKQFAR
jgi:hypothetical protein